MLVYLLLSCSLLWCGLAINVRRLGLPCFYHLVEYSMSLVKVSYLTCYDYPEGRVLQRCQRYVDPCLFPGEPLPRNFCRAMA